MAPRSIWKGYLRIRLVSIPVRAFTATASGARIELRQLHRDCHSPIRYRKVCPLHGEVESDSIVSGYRYSRGSYVVIDPEELERLRRRSDKVVEVEGFLPEGSVDPLYLSGKDYFLLPEGPVGEKAYGLVRRVMSRRGRSALGKVVLSRRERLVLLRPRGRILVMSVLKYAREVKEPAALEDEVGEAEAAESELRLAEELVDAAAIASFDPERHRDEYTARLTELIEAKVEGREIARAPEPEEPKVVELMEALRRSVARATRKKAAPSARRGRAAPGRKRTTG